jgi:GNAT superfamily N-acetyltransferase
MTGAARVHRVYLELRSPEQFREPSERRRDAPVRRVEQCAPELYRRLYAEVGGDWHWRDRAGWSDLRLAEHLADPRVGVWVMYAPDEPEDIAGYFELVMRDDEVEIAYFGLRPGYFGQRLGAELLTRAVEEGWKLGASRVWLHTCSLDSPHALPNYLARGFTRFGEEWY